MDKPDADVVEVVTQLIHLDRIRRKKPEELKSIMRGTLSDEQQAVVLAVRKRKMRKSAKQERTFNKRHSSDPIGSARYSRPILPPIRPLMGPRSNRPNY